MKKLEIMSQSEEQNKTLETNHKVTQISQLPNKECF